MHAYTPGLWWAGLHLVNGLGPARGACCSLLRGNCHQVVLCRVYASCCIQVFLL